ncbi:hypothetical protein Taro_034614 [Colocasia esculenta]|uniref:Transposase (putative) gypsy type domain-containing protein n=1 Tax=Colocasia esculenta TaxID=4460 RepID=A0A843WCF0_COLES|nr:hypothetical protein [Colocasia esculenta]
MAREEDSQLTNRPRCLTLSLDHMEAGFQLPLPEVAKALLNRWGLTLIQLTPNSWRTICIFCIICKLRKVQGSAEVFRAQFCLTSSPGSGAGIYYTKHQPDRMQIELAKKYSNKKGWMKRLFFVKRRDGAEWGFPTRVQTARKDTYPFLIQDEAKVSDSLNRAYVRNREGYLMEFQLVQHGLSRPWSVEEVAAGRDQEANEDYAEQITVTPHLVFEGDDVSAMIRIPTVVRAPSLVTTSMAAPTPAEGRPVGGSPVTAKRPQKIRLKKKVVMKATARAVLPSLTEEGGASQPQTAKRRPVVSEQQTSEDGAEEEEVDQQPLMKRKRKRQLEEAAPRVAEGDDEEDIEGEIPRLAALKKRKSEMATELGLVVGHPQEVAPTGASGTSADERSVALVGEETIVQGGEKAPCTAEVPEGAIPSATAAPAVVERSSTTTAALPMERTSATMGTMERTSMMTDALPPNPLTEAAVEVIA